MATASLRSLLAERQHAAVILARYEGLRRIKKQIKAEGRLRLSELPRAAEIVLDGLDQGHQLALIAAAQAAVDAEAQIIVAHELTQCGPERRSSSSISFLKMRRSHRRSSGTLWDPHFRHDQAKRAAVDFAYAMPALTLVLRGGVRQAPSRAGATAPR